GLADPARRRADPAPAPLGRGGPGGGRGAGPRGEEDQRDQALPRAHRVRPQDREGVRGPPLSEALASRESLSSLPLPLPGSLLPLLAGPALRPDAYRGPVAPVAWGP